MNHIIPGNYHAVRSIRLVTNRMASAVLEGLAEREATLQAEMEEMQEMAAEAFALSEREDAALSEVPDLDEATIAEVAASFEETAPTPAAVKEERKPEAPVISSPSEAIENMMENLPQVTGFEDDSADE